ncbi:cupredoxin domain-containing protein [Streptomyces violascens]|uniref:cupredoxin domain-containing protein n=1 Tax=Streptomyces violascens TaxID=67381 RepID=UPI0019A32CEB|nr:cupredoxin family copper-binding protein [Streptomyces violascens]GGU47289.1 hypothetical protein GCM10010289_79810 [Streptomyces violascens]
MKRRGSILAALASMAVLTAAPASFATPHAPAATAQVAIANFAFSPATLNISRGTTVTWTNQDSDPHTVTSTDSGGPLNSPMLSQSDTYSFTFNSAGTFSYICTVHPAMQGTVVVS